MRLRSVPGLLLASWLWLAGPAHAGLFDDEQARKAILDLRQKQEQTEARLKAVQSDAAQVEQLKRSLLDLNNQIESLRSELAGLRNQNEQLARDVAELQRQQKDMQQGVEDRIRKLEPQKVAVDGKEFLADQDEKRVFEEAMATLRKSDFALAASQLSSFMKRYPNSGYKPTAFFWLGNAQYGMRDYKEAMNSFRSLVNTAPDHARAAESLLSIANCQIELRDTKSARQTLNELLKTYPKSEAAQAGKDRLASLR